MVQEMVMMLFFLPSFVVTSTTGPDSNNVNALPIFIFFIETPCKPTLRARHYSGDGKQSHLATEIRLKTIGMPFEIPIDFLLQVTLNKFRVSRLYGVTVVHGIVGL